MMKPILQNHLMCAVAVAGMALGGLLVVLAGCGSDSVVSPEPSWEEIRYHRSEASAGGSYGDIVIRASGEMELHSKLPGEGATTRGLLAGENLETLARLLDALPPADYAGSRTCGALFFFTVQHDGSMRSYQGGICDADLPASVRAVVDQLDTWVVHAWSKKVPIEFRTLAQGERSRVGVEHHRIIRNRDELVRTLELIEEGGVGLLPSIDFRKEVLIATFLGKRPSAGYPVTITGAHRTKGEQTVLTEQWVVPGPDCQVDERETSPYVLVAVTAVPGNNILFERVTVEDPCESHDPPR
jgi:hypothetical protein